MKRVRLGFTIIELMIVILISAILMMLAVPSYQGFIKRNNIQSLQNRVAAAVVTARSEAASRNAVATLCASRNGTACGGVWNDGWIVFLDDGEGNAGIAQNSQREGDEQIILSYTNIGNYQISVFDETGANALSAFSFNSQGFSLNETRALVTVCEPDGDVKYARGLIIERSGRTMITRDLNDEDGIHESRFDDGFGNVTIKNLSC
jgi:type IV fimbrial biogenesis protein FimT